MHPQPHLSMYLKCRIHRRGPPCQIQYLAIPQKNKDTTSQQLSPDGIDKITRTDRILLLPFLDGAEPGRIVQSRTRGAGTAPFHFVLIGKMGGHPILCHLMHVRRANLHLHALTLVYECRMEGLIPIRFGKGNVILHLGGHGLKAGQMLHQSEDVVAEPHAAVGLLHLLLGYAAPVDGGSLPRIRRKNDAQRHQIGNVIQIPIVFHFHLVPKRIQLLRTSLHLDPHVLTLQRRIVVERLLQHLDGIVQRFLELGLPLSQPSLEPFVLHRIQVHEGDVLQLRFERPQSHAMRQRREDVQRLPADLPLLLGLHVAQRAHVVQPIGELDDDDAIIVRHGHEHLAEVLGLLVGVVGEGELGKLGHLGLALHNVLDLLAEHGLDLLEGEVGVLDGIVKEAGHDGLGVHSHPREEEGHLHGMDDEGFPRLAHLAPVRAVGHP
mmetsp:Transcript_35693/g.75203  ORF Transcript_35693/g.75203 Transcript_35693/m.75203 type:complete len:436 (-) Transcript_35693:947-2254(-)